jgi:phasin family protein
MKTPKTSRRATKKGRTVSSTLQELPAMAAKIDDSLAYLEFTKRAFAPVARFNELAIRNVEQFARFQYEVLGDCVQTAIDQLNAVASTRDFGTLASRQAEIVNRAADKAGKRSQELVKLATESQTQFAKWVEDTTVSARKAA